MCNISVYLSTYANYSNSQSLLLRFVLSLSYYFTLFRLNLFSFGCFSSWANIKSELLTVFYFGIEGFYQHSVAIVDVLCTTCSAGRSEACQSLVQLLEIPEEYSIFETYRVVEEATTMREKSWCNTTEAFGE